MDFAGIDDADSKDVALRNIRVDRVGKDGIKAFRAQKVFVPRGTASNNVDHRLDVAGRNTVAVRDSLFAVDGVWHPGHRPQGRVDLGRPHRFPAYPQPVSWMRLCAACQGRAHR